MHRIAGVERTRAHVSASNKTHSGARGSTHAAGAGRPGGLALAYCCRRASSSCARSRSQCRNSASLAVRMRWVPAPSQRCTAHVRRRRSCGHLRCTSARTIGQHLNAAALLCVGGARDVGKRCIGRAVVVIVVSACWVSKRTTRHTAPMGQQCARKAGSMQRAPWTHVQRAAPAGTWRPTRSSAAWPRSA